MQKDQLNTIEGEQNKDTSKTISSIIDKLNRKYGPNTISKGSRKLYNPQRVGTGIFPLTLALAGGYPLYGTTCLWGGTGGAKTTTAIQAMLAVSNLCFSCFHTIDLCVCGKKLKMKTVWADVEGTLDTNWVALHGVSEEDYYYVLCNSGEQYIDIADASLASDDCGLVVIDSIGALCPDAEMENSAMDSNMGKHPQLLTRSIRKLKQRLIREKKRGHPCFLILINQMRNDFKVMFGSNESMPGGNALIHDFSLILRCGKKSMDKSKHSRYFDEEKAVWIASRQTIVVKDTKVAIYRGSLEYLLTTSPIPKISLESGRFHDVEVFLAYCDKVGVLTKKSGYTLQGVDNSFKTLSDLAKFLYSNPMVYFELQKNIVDSIIGVAE
jgi:RecA/RadA recombinase